MTSSVPTGASTSPHQRWREHRQSASQAPDMVVGVASSHTAEPVEAFLGVGLLDHGFAPRIAFADYNQIHQVCFDPENTIGAVDSLVILWRIEDMFATDLRDALGGAEGAVDRLADDVAQLASAIAGLTARVDYPVFVSVPPVPSTVGLDMLDSSVGLRLTRLHGLVVETFVSALGGTSVRFADVSGWLREFGAERARDTIKAFVYKQPYSADFWRVIGRNLADLIARETVPAPKCVVLDCDNTLWGGVIGEDGIGGIEISSTFPGSAFQEFQRVLKGLRESGTLLAVNSKNNLADVMEVFEKHDDMVLRPSDIAVWRVNWQLKSVNLQEIAAELNIGEDALVFVDDSHYELAEIAAALPHVRTVQVPEELALLPDLLPTSGLFRNVRVSDEDRARTDMVISERDRRRDESAMSKEEFLASLELTVDFFEVGEEHIGRVAQLTNKTNQFNLTTIRRTEAEVRTLVEDPDHFVRAIRVSDKFGDYGLVGVSILRREESHWELDTLLMSCRVLGRGVETAFLAQLVEEASRGGAELVVGRYAPTPKNVLVADLYLRHGFADAGGGRFEAHPSAVAAAPAHIKFGGAC